MWLLKSKRGLGLYSHISEDLIAYSIIDCLNEKTKEEEKKVRVQYSYRDIYLRQ